jgi:hypothetical protein
MFFGPQCIRVIRQYRNTSSAIGGGHSKIPISRVNSRGGEEGCEGLKKYESAFQVFVLVTRNEVRMRLC